MQHMWPLRHFYLCLVDDCLVDQRTEKTSVDLAYIFALFGMDIFNVISLVGWSFETWRIHTYLLNACTVIGTLDSIQVEIQLTKAKLISRDNQWYSSNEPLAIILLSTFTG